jgi:hypothetical protein
MSDHPDDYDACADWVPPAKVYGDEVLVNDTGPDGLGPDMPFWKVLLWHTAKARTEMLRNDSVGASALGYEDKPPRLAADEEPIPSEVLSAIEQKIAELTVRLDAYERMKAADQALIDLENRIEAELPPDTDTDDDGEMIRVH